MKQKLISIDGVSVSKKVKKGNGSGSGSPPPGFVSLDGHGHIPFVDAAKERTFTITPGDIANAKCGDMRSCVLANMAIRTFGETVEEVIVGKTVAHILRRNAKGILESTRYALSSKLRKAVHAFDKKLGWNLPIGDYDLLPMSKTAGVGGRKNRRKLYGGSGGVQSTLKNKIQAPSRRIICKID